MESTKLRLIENWGYSQFMYFQNFMSTIISGSTLSHCSHDETGSKVCIYARKMTLRESKELHCENLCNHLSFISVPFG